MTKRRMKRAVAGVCTAFLLLGGWGLPSLRAPLTVRADAVDDLRTRKEELERQAKELQRQKDNLTESLGDQEQKRNYIEQQIALKEEEIYINDSLIYAVEQEIMEKDSGLTERERSIAAKEQEISDRFSQLQNRLRTISKTGNLSSLQMLLSTDDYVDYLLKSKIMKQIATNDQQLIEGLEGEIGLIRKEKEALEGSKKELEAKRAELLGIREDAEQDKEELDALCYEVRLVMYELQSDISYYNSQLEKVKADEAELERQIERIIRESSGGNTVLSGKLQWPSDSCTIVTCYYGGRYLDGEYNFHKGIDIACYGSAHGKDIRAAANGTVLYTNTTDSWGGGYGYYLMIDHGYDSYGRRIVTLYAHCSRILVYDGQEVLGGEQVAEIGNTGWSYGAHLHFEVRVDGTPEDPLTNGWVVIP